MSKDKTLLESMFNQIGLSYSSSAINSSISLALPIVEYALLFYFEIFIIIIEISQNKILVDFTIFFGASQGFAKFKLRYSIVFLEYLSLRVDHHLFKTYSKHPIKGNQHRVGAQV